MNADQFAKRLSWFERLARVALDGQFAAAELGRRASYLSEQSDVPGWIAQLAKAFDESQAIARDLLKEQLSTLEHLGDLLGSDERHRKQIDELIAEIKSLRAKKGGN